MLSDEEERAELAAHAAAAEARLSAVQAENEELRAEAALLHAELAAHAAHLADVYASTSWRLSAPVRLVGRQAGRLSRSAHSGMVRREAGRLARLLAPGLVARLRRRRTTPRSTESQSQTDPLLLAAEAKQLDYRPIISVLVPVFNTPPQYLRLAVDSVVAQAYPEWELLLCDDGSTKGETLVALRQVPRLDPRIRVHFLDANRGIAAATNAALAMAKGDFVAMLDHDDELLPGALLEIAKVLNADPTLDVVYTDQDYVEADGTVAETFSKPDWSLEMFRGVMYVGHLLAVRRTLADDVGGFDSRFDNVQDYEFMLRVAERTQRIAHVPKILYHWRRIPGSVAFGGDEKRSIEPRQAAAVNAHLERCGIPAVARSNPAHAHRLLISPKPRPDHPPVSVVIRASGVETHLEACVERILAGGGYPDRQIIVTGGDIPRAEATRLQGMGILLEAAGARESTAGLEGIAVSTGQLIVFMSADLEVVTPEWLEHFLFDCELPGVACVAPVILSPAGEVASAGLILGGREGISPAMPGWGRESDGHAGSLSCVREVSAVSGACFAVTREVLSGLGGLNPYLATDHYRGADLSLRAFSKGFRNLCTPRIIARRRAPAALDDQDSRLDRLLLLDAWELTIRSGDPYYSPDLMHVAYGHRA